MLCEYIKIPGRMLEESQGLRHRKGGTQTQGRDREAVRSADAKRAMWREAEGAGAAT